MPRFRRAGLQGERHLSARKKSRPGPPRTPLAGRQSAQQFEMRPVQEDLLDVGMFIGVPMRMVRDNGE